MCVTWVTCTALVCGAFMWGPGGMRPRPHPGLGPHAGLQPLNVGGRFPRRGACIGVAATRKAACAYVFAVSVSRDPGGVLALSAQLRLERAAAGTSWKAWVSFPLTPRPGWPHGDGKPCRARWGPTCAVQLTAEIGSDLESCVAITTVRPRDFVSSPNRNSVPRRHAVCIPLPQPRAPPSTSCLGGFDGARADL